MPTKCSVFFLSFCKMAIFNQVNFYPILDEYWTIVLFLWHVLHVSAVMFKVQFTMWQKVFLFLLFFFQFSVWLLYWIVMHIFFSSLSLLSTCIAHNRESFYDLFSVLHVRKWLSTHFWQIFQCNFRIAENILER